MREDDGMPVCQIENVSLSLVDRDDEGGAEELGVKKTR